jgi:RimJ/RimL family protein N-acetyltransferase
MTDTPLGPLVDATPRPWPARVTHRGPRVNLEPLDARRHLDELWLAASADRDESWAYMGYGPFASKAALAAVLEGFAAAPDPMFFAVRPHSLGTAEGWMSLMEIFPRHAHIEIGNIWLGPRLRRSAAATEAMFLLMRHAMDELGYRRLTWKCNALNAPSRRAADRLGFTYEGTLRNVLVIKGRRRDTAWFSILDDEWPSRRDAIAAWLQPANFRPDGSAIASLAAQRAPDHTAR